MNIKNHKIQFFKGNNDKKYKAIVFKNNEKIKTI
jgi:hypothetical protein